MTLELLVTENVFATLANELAGAMTGRPVDSSLETYLNAQFGKGSPQFSQLRQLCIEGERDGWLMQREAGGIKFGRAIKPNTKAASFSVDVVRMREIAGPHHIHTNGEIGAIIPIEGDPRFDGKAEGWYVYPAGSSHHPTVTGGDAYVVYFLPEGAIEFTGR
jgi:hypothetical protein